MQKHKDLFLRLQQEAWESFTNAQIAESIITHKSIDLQFNLKIFSTPFIGKDLQTVLFISDVELDPAKIYFYDLNDLNDIEPNQKKIKSLDEAPLQGSWILVKTISDQNWIEDISDKNYFGDSYWELSNMSRIDSAHTIYQKIDLVFEFFFERFKQDTKKHFEGGVNV